MKDKEKAQDIATQRAMLIAPLLSHDLDRGEARMIRLKFLNFFKVMGFINFLSSRFIHISCSLISS